MIDNHAKNLLPSPAIGIVSDTDTYYTDFGEINTQAVYGVFLAYFSRLQATKISGVRVILGNIPTTVEKGI
jgi:hypothetical protein